MSWLYAMQSFLFRFSFIILKKEPKFYTYLYQALFCLVRILRKYIFLYILLEYIGFACRSCQSSNKAEIVLPSQKYQRINLLCFSLIPGINLEAICCSNFRSQLIYSQIYSMTSNNLNTVILNQLCCLNPVFCIGMFNSHSQWKHTPEQQYLTALCTYC